MTDENQKQNSLYELNLESHHSLCDFRLDSIMPYGLWDVNSAIIKKEAFSCRTTQKMMLPRDVPTNSFVARI